MKSRCSTIYRPFGCRGCIDGHFYSLEIEKISGCSASSWIAAQHSKGRKRSAEMDGSYFWSFASTAGAVAAARRHLDGASVRGAVTSPIGVFANKKKNFSNYQLKSTVFPSNILKYLVPPCYSSSALTAAMASCCPRSLFRCDKGVSGFQPSGRSQRIGFCLNALCDTTVRDQRALQISCLRFKRNTGVQEALRNISIMNIINSSCRR